jgi:hypothetical protein
MIDPRIETLLILPQQCLFSYISRGITVEMAKGNPKGNPQNLTPQAHELTSEDRRKGGKVVGKRKKVQAIVDELLNNENLAVIVESLIDRAESNSKDLELLLAIMGEKPKEQVEITQEKPFEVTIEVIE